MNAYDLGYKAYREAENVNPFQKTSHEWDDWVQGWLDAASDWQYDEQFYQ